MSRLSLLPTLSRRTLLAAPLAASLAPAAAFAGKPSRAARRERFLASPAKGTAVMAYAFYTRPRGGDMMSIEERWSRSDTVDFAWIRRSRDYGRTWTPPVAMTTGERRPEGTLRRHPRCGFVDHHGRYLEFWNEGLLPSDDPLEGLRAWNIYYHVSRDGGRTFDSPSQVIHSGAGYNASHPLPGVWTGKNCAMLGEMTCVPIGAPGGGILVPVVISPLAPDDQLYNPAGAYTYTDAMVLLGKWFTAHRCLCNHFTQSHRVERRRAKFRSIGFRCISPFGRRGKEPPDPAYVSFSPSKIPYGGFSPVRLQTGLPPLRPSAQTRCA